MKIDANKSDVQVIGNITEFKTGIDPKNLEYITTLLSSNLYSAPEQSFMREIVSNAWDSHVEAGTTDIPVIIKLNSINNTITIRDYGTGLSPERFEEVYCNIGSSTKRDTNDYIGGFGIGKYSSLACSNVVNITSYYEGKEYKYLMVKSGNNITTNLVSTLDTKEENGVMVSIRINMDDMYKYCNALQYLVFFPNIYVHTDNYYRVSDYNANNIVTYFNKTKIKRFKNFAFANIPIKDKILLGNVLYPCDWTKLDSEAAQYLRKIKNSGIVININIGEINITPNRESIIYTSETIEILNKRIKEAYKEIIDVLKSHITKDCDDIIDYSSSLYNTSGFDFIENKINKNMSYGSYCFTIPSDILYDCITFKGNHYDLNSVINKVVLYLGWCNVKFVVYADRICSYPNYPSYMTSVKNNYRAISLPLGFRCSQIVKAYLRENYEGCVILDGITEQGIKDYLKNEFKSYETDKDFNIFVEETSKSLIKRVEFVDFNTDSDFLKYKKEYHDKFKEEKSKNEETVYLYKWIYHDEEYSSIKTIDVFKGIKSILKYIKSIKGLVIVDYIDTSNNLYAEASLDRHASFITAKKSVVKAILEARLSNVRPVNYLTNDKFAVKAYTVLKYINSKNAENGSFILETVPKKDYDGIKEVLTLYNKVKGMSNYIKVINTLNTKEDPYIAGLCKKYLDYFNKYNRTVQTIFDDDFSTANKKLVSAVLIKNKEYRVNYRTYRKVKQSKVISILCKK